MIPALDIENKTSDANLKKPFTDFTKTFFDVDIDIEDDNKGDMLLLVMRLNAIHSEYELKKYYNSANKYIADYQENNKETIIKFNSFYAEILSDKNELEELKENNINQVFDFIKSRPMLYL